jgi:hypothetical protein
MRTLPALLLLPALSIAGDTGEHELGWLVGCWTTPDGSAQEVQVSTTFTATAIMKNSAVFVNADHDYPQRIKYSRVSNQLQATISRLNGTNPVSFDKIACN